MIITLHIQYQDTKAVHEWLDRHIPRWSYCGSQFYLLPEYYQSLTSDELHELYKRQRLEWAEFYPRQRVTQHFQVGTLSTKQLALVKQNFKVTIPATLFNQDNKKADTEHETGWR